MVRTVHKLQAIKSLSVFKKFQNVYNGDHEIFNWLTLEAFKESGEITIMMLNQKSNNNNKKNLIMAPKGQMRQNLNWGVCQVCWKNVKAFLR